MKNTKTILAIVLVVILLFVFVGCDKYPAVTKALEKAGYEYADGTSVLSAVANAALKEYYGDEEVKAVVYTWRKGGTILTLDQGIVIEFKNQKELKEFYDQQSNTIKGAVDDFRESDVCNGNCIIISASKDMIEVFKNA